MKKKIINFFAFVVFGNIQSFLMKCLQELADSSPWLSLEQTLTSLLKCLHCICIWDNTSVKWNSMSPALRTWYHYHRICIFLVEKDVLIKLLEHCYNIYIPHRLREHQCGFGLNQHTSWFNYIVYCVHEQGLEFLQKEIRLCGFRCLMYL